MSICVKEQVTYVQTDILKEGFLHDSFIARFLRFVCAVLSGHLDFSGNITTGS